MNTHAKPALFLSVLLSLGAVLLPGAVRAADEHLYNLPLAGCDRATSCSATFNCYITAYFDLNQGSGTLKDWNCKEKTYSKHKGTDFGVQGTYGVRQVVAAADGVVAYASDGCYDRNGQTGDTCGGGYGNYVKLTHSDTGHSTYYAHMAKGSVAVSKGQSVKCGDLLGKAASSGNSTGPHLHFEVRYSSDSVRDDPYTGTCGGPLTYWKEQNGWCGLPSDDQCAVVPFNDALFTAETIPDDTTFAPGQTFTKTWTFKNTGNTTWTAAEGYQLIHAGGESLASGSSVAMGSGSVAPGASKTWSVAMTAPTVPGTYTSHWRMAQSGTSFGTQVWVRIRVESTAAEANDAAFVSETIPDGTVFAPGQAFTKTWTFENTGTSTWTKAGGHRLIFKSGAQMGASSPVLLGDGESVAPGARKTWSVPMTAPATAGPHEGAWCLEQGGACFGDEPYVNIAVAASAQAVDGATFVSETVPDGTRFLPGATFTKTWTLKNTGSSTWSSSGGQRLVFVEGELLSAISPVALGEGESVAPEASKVWSVAMTAPSSKGSKRGEWQMAGASGARFGDAFWVEIEVAESEGVNDADFVSETIPDDSVYEPGASFTKSWTLKNTGTTTWSRASGHKLVFQGGTGMGAAREVTLGEGETVAPGASKTWTVAMTAPSTVRTHTDIWRLAQGSAVFGDSVWARIKVVASDACGVSGDASVYPGAPELCDGKDNDCDGEIDEGLVDVCVAESGAEGTRRCAAGSWGACEPAATDPILPILVNDAALLSETVPDDSVYAPGAAFTKSWTVRNTGTATWSKSAGHRFAFQGGEGMGSERLFELGEGEQIAPGAARTWTVALKAPEAQGTYTDMWRMEQSGSGGFGENIWVRIRVAEKTAQDADGDGHLALMYGGDDCDDGDATVFLGAPELCDGKDNDCDGEIDEGLAQKCVASGSTCQGSQVCVSGKWSACDALPSTLEVCNGRDDDCNGVADDGAQCTDGFSCQSGFCLSEGGPDAGAEGTHEENQGRTRIEVLSSVGCQAASAPGGSFAWIGLGALGGLFLRRRRRSS